MLELFRFSVMHLSSFKVVNVDSDRSNHFSALYLKTRAAYAKRDDSWASQAGCFLLLASGNPLAIRKRDSSCDSEAGCFLLLASGIPLAIRKRDACCTSQTGFLLRLASGNSFAPHKPDVNIF